MTKSKLNRDIHLLGKHLQLGLTLHVHTFLQCFQVDKGVTVMVINR